MFPEKTICVPASPPADITDFLPIVDHPLFQLLRDRKQLGVNYLVFPGAVHSRFEHAVGSLALTERLCRVQGISGERRRHLCAFALLHDIGHGPFSHQTEEVLEGNHHQRGLVCLEEMKPVLSACGLAYQELEAMFLGERPDTVFVSDRNLGTDKLDYLMRDALHIGFTGVPDVERIQFFTVLVDAQLAIEEKYTEEIKRLQKFYSYLHQHGYLNKTALTAQRMLQRAVEERLLETPGAQSALWAMTDGELLAWLAAGEHQAILTLSRRLASRHLHRSAIVLRPEGYGFTERRSDNALQIREWPLAKLRRFATLAADAAWLRDLEDALASRLKLKPGEILFAAMPYFRKLLPRDVRVYAVGGETFNLFDKDRAHFRSLEADYLHTFAVRLVTPPECRELVAKHTELALSFLQDALS